MNASSKEESIFDHPREFIPDRWSKDAAEKLHPFSSLPFGFGPRSCYGKIVKECFLMLAIAFWFLHQ